jgi:hypothetical protein
MWTPHLRGVHLAIEPAKAGFVIFVAVNELHRSATSFARGFSLP